VWRVVAPANPFDVLRSYAIVMRPSLAQAYGQVQALGYTPPFILAVGLQLFRRFLGAPLQHARRALPGASLVALALVGRLVGQLLAPNARRAIVRVVSALALPIGIPVAGSVSTV
jgi:hypothetical protein